jgi:hypothetical protein
MGPLQFTGEVNSDGVPLLQDNRTATMPASLFLQPIR